ncbi:MAG: hypothetical protein ACX939_03970 [Hyphococcus sp.]
MGGINITRLLIGGVVAGIIIIGGEVVLNGIVLADQWRALQEQHLIAAPSAFQYGAGAVITLLYGLTLMWIYAAIRPRFGPSFKTAIIAGLTFWFIAYALFLSSVWANGFVTAEVALVSILWGLVEAPIAALAGAAVYRESSVA